MHYDVVSEEKSEIWCTGFANKQEITVAPTNRSLVFNLTCSREVHVSNLVWNNDCHHWGFSWVFLCFHIYGTSH